jgi:hypothetical protein
MTDNLLDIPLLFTEVLGYRSWRLEDHKLKPIVYPIILGDYYKINNIWEPGVATALCKKEHEAPHNDCVCGLHAHYSVNDMLEAWGVWRCCWVYGATISWGNIDTTSTDFRAQYSQIVCLSYCRKQARKHIDEIISIAREYEVPCVDIRELSAVAEEFASVIPKSLRGII